MKFTQLQDHAEVVAPRLIGSEFVRTFEDGTTSRVRIVETEAYHESDEASHSFRGKTPRTEVMFGKYGHLYVYFTYGMHYCMNVVTGDLGEGSAVLIRAVEPVEGESYLERNRSASGVNLTNGPAKLCQALKINTSFNGHDLTQPPLELTINEALLSSEIIATTRIGISKDTHRVWRFYDKKSRYVSRRDAL